MGPTGRGLLLAVLGDSIAFGQGASQPGDTIGARLAAQLTAAGRPTTVRVYAVPGARSDGLPAQVEQAVAVRPDIAVIVVGANDLTHFVPPQRAGDLLGAAVRALRFAGSQVVVAPAPDMSVVPWVPLQAREMVRAGSAALRRAQTSQALAHGAKVGDVEGATSTRFATDPSLFSPDRFHPSSAGYALIAQALAPAVLSAAADVQP